MRSSFEDRLNRINANTAEGPATPPAEEFVGRLFPREHLPFQPGDPNASAATFSERYNNKILRNVAGGFIWMSITGFAASHFFTVREWAKATPIMAPDYLTYMTFYVVALALSLGAFAYTAHHFSDHDDWGSKVESTTPVSLTIGGVIGLVLGLGPETLLAIAEHVR